MLIEATVLPLHYWAPLKRTQINKNHSYLIYHLFMQLTCCQSKLW